MNTSVASPTPDTPAQTPRELLKKLHAQYAVFRDYRPLAIGVDKMVLAKDPEIERKTLRHALGMHTNSGRYLKAMKEAKERFDLDGNVSGEVTDEHRKRATELLQQRFKKQAELRKTQREAEEAAEAERRRAEKLSQLAAKFSRS